MIMEPQVLDRSASQEVEPRIAHPRCKRCGSKLFFTQRFALSRCPRCDGGGRLIGSGEVARP